jgi:ferredoxin-NADP reductase
MKARLVSYYDLCPEVRHFVFEVPELAALDFKPGQFVSFSAEIGGKKILRPYSIASPPDGSNRFDLCLNRVPGGLLSPVLFDMRPGDEIEMKGPLGYFTLRNPGREAVFVATGTGIAPFRSLLLAHVPELSSPFTLVFGTRYEETLLYRAEFDDLARRHPHFHFLPVLSRPPANWQGLTGHVQPHMLEAIGTRRDLDVYLCGLKLMVDDARAQLKDLGFDRKQIIFEKYD